MKHVISIGDFETKGILKVLENSSQMVFLAKERQNKRESIPYLKERPKVTLFFLEPSTRTLGSYSEAISLLGWEKEILFPEVSSLKKKESFANTVRMLAIQGAKILVLRTPQEGAPRFAAEISEKEGYEVAIHNAGDGANQHPTQTFLDLLTIAQELGRLDNFILGIVGDLKYSRTVHSLLCALSKISPGLKVKLVSAPETKLPEKYKKGLEVEESESLEILKECDVIYVTRIQEERFLDPRELERVKGKYKITKEVLDSFKKGVKIMHPLPYVDEICPEIRKDPRVIFDIQAWYGIPTRMALLKMSWERIKEKSCEKENYKIEQKVIIRENLETYFKEREKRKKTEEYFRPIRVGTVIDHLQLGMGKKIKKMIEKLNRAAGVIHLIEGVPSKKMGKKDVIVLEGDFLQPELMGAISFFSPLATFNVMREGFFTKIKIEKIEGFSIGKCPNPNCITNYDPEAFPKFKVITSDVACCSYCEREFNREEITL